MIAREPQPAPRLERWVIRSEAFGVKGRGTVARPIAPIFDESTALEAAVLAYLETVPDALTR